LDGKAIGYKDTHNSMAARAAHWAHYTRRHAGGATKSLSRHGILGVYRLGLWGLTDFSRLACFTALRLLWITHASPGQLTYDTPEGDKERTASCVCVALDSIQLGRSGRLFHPVRNISFLTLYRTFPDVVFCRLFLFLISLFRSTRVSFCQGALVWLDSALWGCGCGCGCLLGWRRGD